MPTTFLVVTMLNSVLDLLQAKMVSTQVIVEKQCDDLLQITAVFGELRQVISSFCSTAWMLLAKVAGSRCGLPHHETP